MTWPSRWKQLQERKVQEEKRQSKLGLRWRWKWEQRLFHLIIDKKFPLDFETLNKDPRQWTNTKRNSMNCLLRMTYTKILYAPSEFLCQWHPSRILLRCSRFWMLKMIITTEFRPKHNKNGLVEESGTLIKVTILIIVN